MKERLTGALILVALIVLLVPELLSGPVRSAPRTSTAAAGAGEEPPLRSYTISLADDSHAHAAARAVAAEVPPPAPPPVIPAAPVSPAAPVAPATPVTAGSAAVNGPGGATASEHQAHAANAGAPTAASAAGASGGWMVQLGSFASRDNADRLAKQLRGGGFQVSVSQGTTGRRLYRVRAGPVADHAAAEQLAGKLHAQGHSGEIVPK